MHVCIYARACAHIDIYIEKAYPLTHGHMCLRVAYTTTMVQLCVSYGIDLVNANMKGSRPTSAISRGMFQRRRDRSPICMQIAGRLVVHQRIAYAPANFALLRCLGQDSGCDIATRTQEEQFLKK